MFPEVSGSAINITPSKNWPSPVSARDLFTNPPATPEVLIEGMLYRGGTMLIAGPSKARKSFTLIDAAVSIAYGEPWLGLVTTQTPVLYLNFELQEFAIGKRVNEVSNAKDLQPPTELHFLNLRNHLTDIARLERELPALIARLKVGVVVIDPHYKISSVSGLEENSNDDQAQLLARVEALCGTANTAVILAHHFSKGTPGKKNQIDRASGGGVFARWPDVFMTLTDHKESGAMVFECALRNFAPIEPFVATWAYPLWRRDTKLSPTQLKTSGAGEQFPATEAAKRLDDGMTYTAWQAASGMTETTFRRKRDELIESNAVMKTGNKYYRSHSEAPVETGNSQNRQNSQFNRHNSTSPSTEPAATTFRGGGGGGAEDQPPRTTATSEQEAGAFVATATPSTNLSPPGVAA